MNNRLYKIEDLILEKLEGKFVETEEPERRKALMTSIAKTLDAAISSEDIDEIYKDVTSFEPITAMLENADIEDIMVNNTSNIFVYLSKQGVKKQDIKLGTRDELDRFVSKLKLYATNSSAMDHIFDIHLPQGSRANIVSSPLGYDITIRNFRRLPLSVIDLINLGEMDYNIAARLWIYVDGFRIRPANMLIGGIPASGKTTLLNSLFSFIRPEQRIVTIEETYELNTDLHENAVRLETSKDMPMVDLVKNSLRMRPDMIIVGEVRGVEANDMITAMNIGKICMGTIHASTTRDMINRLEHSPMNVPRDIIPVLDALMVVSPVYKGGLATRKLIQISEISGIETQVLLSDLYKFDYRSHQSAPVLPSVAYRDTLCKLLNVPPTDLLAEEAIRAKMLEQMNKMGKRDMASISEIARSYYYEPDNTLRKLNLSMLQPAIKI